MMSTEDPTGSPPQISSGCCRVCGEVLAEHVIWCYECDTPCHRECFAYAGRCAVYGCTGMRYKEAPGRAVGAKWIEIRADSGHVIPQSFSVDFSSRRESILAATAAYSFSFAI